MSKAQRELAQRMNLLTEVIDREPDHLSGVHKRFFSGAGEGEVPVHWLKAKLETSEGQKAART